MSSVAIPFAAVSAVNSSRVADRIASGVSWGTNVAPRIPRQRISDRVDVNGGLDVIDCSRFIGRKRSADTTGRRSQAETYFNKHATSATVSSSDSSRSAIRFGAGVFLAAL